ncbi:uncharacterized protein [Palaemon carinicauda]|uniref:uncharacterized protein n=1 Tax=Palaemon carinicauda TaxID=392227 RepID=UPI0035B62684
MKMSNVILLMVIGSVLPMPDKVKRGSVSPASSPRDGSNLESDDEHLPWELVGEYVQGFDITADDYGEEELEDAKDPQMLTEDLCLSLLSNENVLEDLILQHPHNTTTQVKFRRCFRSRWNVENTCRQRYVRYRASKFCCPVADISPILSRKGSVLRCRCPIDD